MLIANNAWLDDRETRLMLNFSQGDDAAFDLLVDTCQGGLVQFLTLLSGDRNLGEDLAQETFIRLYRSRASYRPKARLKTFLYRIARNLWADHLRALNKRPGDLSLDTPNDTGTGLQEKLATTDRDPFAFDTKSLYRALDRLPETQREALLLSQIEEMSHEEIASALAIPAGTVKSRIHHAIRKLRLMLMRQGTK